MPTSQARPEQMLDTYLLRPDPPARKPKGPGLGSNYIQKAANPITPSVQGSTVLYVLARDLRIGSQPTFHTTRSILGDEATRLGSTASC